MSLHVDTVGITFFGFLNMNAEVDAFLDEFVSSGRGHGLVTRNLTVLATVKLPQTKSQKKQDIRR
jgi:hypothetical protein